MTESTELQTPEEEAALRAVEAKYWRRHRWIALYSSVTVSAHTTLILYALWDGWPLQERDMGLLAFMLVNALGGLGWVAWNLWAFRRDEAMARQWTLQRARWRAQDRARDEHRAERRGQSWAGEAR